MVSLIEETVIELLGAHGVEAERRKGAPGVYVDGAKIAALGLRVRRGCCYHGVALNVDMDLAPFSANRPLRLPGARGSRRPARLESSQAPRKWATSSPGVSPGCSTNDDPRKKERPGEDAHSDRACSSRTDSQSPSGSACAPPRPARVSTRSSKSCARTISTRCARKASCPNIGECFGKGTATFMILAICVRGAARSATSPTAAARARSAGA